ncbi:MAG: hypothetical protein HW416_635 [Chloroflexi bacterium]|nr:hypothetical protein [Chloroflexota bacterium]
MLTTQRGNSAQFGMDAVAIGARVGTKSPGQLVDGLLSLLVDADLPPQIRTSLIEYVDSGGGLSSSQAVDRSVRGVTHLIMSTPVYQMA